MRDATEQRLRREAIEAAVRYYEYRHKPRKEFRPGDPIHYAGRVFDEAEVENLIDASLDFWLTAGRYADRFEREFADYLGVEFCSLVNSGSSANLLAFSALTSPKLGDRRILRGDEVITVAAGFPTTVAPLVQYGAVPVFVDVEIPTYNIDCSRLEEALSPRTKAVMAAHTLGNPFDVARVKEFCRRHGLWLVEDNCDSLGSLYRLDGELAMTGTFGDMGTSSFYPPHHMTMGEGGAVCTRSAELKRLVDSFRDWGRDCWCASGRDNTCGNRFGRRFGELPPGYDHKYVFAHFGYNLKTTDLQAAIGCAQIGKLPSFVEARRRNWDYLREALSDLSDRIVLPEATAGSLPSWFGFMFTIREDSGIDRAKVVEHLEGKGIQTRMLFAGNLVKHPCFDGMRATGEGYRVAGTLANTDAVMERSLWVGVYPGIDEARRSYMADTVREALSR